MLANALFIGSFVLFSALWLRWAVPSLMAWRGEWFVQGGSGRELLAHSLLTLGLLSGFALFGVAMPSILEMFYQLDEVNPSFVAVVVLAFFSFNWLFATAALRSNLAVLRSSLEEGRSPSQD